MTLVESDALRGALTWQAAGCSIVPIRPGGTKRPTREWSTLQRQALTEAEVRSHWGTNPNYGIAVICGSVSGNLELMELEADATKTVDLTSVAEECDLRGIRPLWEKMLNEGYMEWSPSGGLHLIYRVPEHEIPGNTKLAMRVAEDDELNPEERRNRESNPNLVFWRTRAETRGEGGYVVVAPTSGLCHSSGEPWIVGAGRIGEIPAITWEQRMALHAAINAALDQTPPPAPVAPRQEVAIRTDGELRPGDDWENQHDWDEPWFTGQGWKVSHRVGTETFWVRPGKEARDGHSASTGYNGDKDRLYVWSTSTGLPTEEPLSKFFVYSFYHYGGDMARAASALRKEQYGTPTPTPSSSLMPWTPDADRPVSLPVRGGLDLTDTGSGRRMKDVFGDAFRYNTREGEWYWWTGSAWERDEHLRIWRAAVKCAEDAVTQAQQMLDSAELLGDDDIIKTARRRLHDATQLKNKGKLEAAIKMFSVEEGMALTTDAFDKDPNLLNLPNGTLELESQHLHQHNPTDLITLSMGAELDKDAECPKFEQFMVEAFPDQELRDYVQRCMGYSLLGTAKERAIFVLFGPSGTGKSVLTNLMTRMFGSYGTTAPASTFRVKKQTETLDLHKLKGARFVATSELPEGAQLDEDLVKRISGGDLVTSRGHWEAFTEWRPSCVVWIATNHLPKLNGDDNAIWKRMKTIRMDTEFCGPNEVLGYADVLYEEEASGILNWLLKGLEAYHMLGLDEPEAVRKAVEGYRIDMNLAASFIRDKVEEGVLIRDDDFETKSYDVWNLFSSYCNENHQMPLGARRFQNQLKALGFEPVKIGGKAYWKGLRIAAEHGVRGTIW